MSRTFTLEYWQDDNWFVGKLKEIPGVFSQGKTLAELEQNIQDAYKMMMETDLVNFCLSILLHHAHAALAELLQDFVVGEALVDHCNNRI